MISSPVQSPRAEEGSLDSYQQRRPQVEVRSNRPQGASHQVVHVVEVAAYFWMFCITTGLKNKCYLYSVEQPLVEPYGEQSILRRIHTAEMGSVEHITLSEYVQFGNVATGPLQNRIWENRAEGPHALQNTGLRRHFHLRIAALGNSQRWNGRLYIGIGGAPDPSMVVR